jgi:dTDP-4-dehydrorhamnose 3,5-epimerase
METKTTPIPGLLLIQPKVFLDPRGYFFESYNKQEFSRIGITEDFVQDNQSCSCKGVLRGLHFQASPFAQGKLLYVAQGAVTDIAVDLRKKSSTYSKHFSVNLSAKDRTMFWIPPGFAHGFVTLEDNTIFCYKCTNIYNKDSERIIRWNDPDLNIDWGILNPILSQRDASSPLFKDVDAGF